MAKDGKKHALPVQKGSKLPRLNSVSIWAPLTFLLMLGMLTTVADLLKVPTAETLKANQTRQRAVIDPGTGVVSLGLGETAADEQFDVGDKPVEPEPTVEVAPTTEPVPGDEPAATEPAPENLDAPATEPATPPTEEPKPEPAATTPSPAAASDELPANAPALRTEPLKVDAAMPEYTKDSLVGAPAPEITETVGALKLPKRGLKDATAAKIYAQPFKRKPEQVLLSFVVMDVGLDVQSIGPLLALPKEVTVAYSPYARNAETYGEMFRRQGHELWTTLPAMGERYPSDDPGPLGMIAQMPKEELVRRLREVMGAVVGSVGFILPPDESISGEKESMSAILSEIEARGMVLVSTHPSRSVESISADAKLQGIIRRADLVLDPAPNEAQIRSKLAGVLTSATEKGEYVVVMSARPQTVTILAEWLKETTLPAPVTLAPLSAFYQVRVAPEAKEEEGGGHGAPAKKEDAGHGEAKKEDAAHAAPEKKKEESSGHGEKKESGGHGEEKPKPKPKPKGPKVLPQDKYKQTEKKSSGGGGH